VIVGPDHEIRSTGYNGLPRGTDDENPARLVRPQKYFYWEHSERNAIYNAARVGIPLKGCTIYIITTPEWIGPCADCCRAIIQSGIVRVVQDRPLASVAARWGESTEAGLAMLKEAGIVVDQVNLCEHPEVFDEAAPTDGRDHVIWRCSSCSEEVA
jgi:dCMP deaminase